MILTSNFFFSPDLLYETRLQSSLSFPFPFRYSSLNVHLINFRKNLITYISPLYAFSVSSSYRVLRDLSFRFRRLHSIFSSFTLLRLKAPQTPLSYFTLHLYTICFFKRSFNDTVQISLFNSSDSWLLVTASLFLSYLIETNDISMITHSFHQEKHIRPRWYFTRLMSTNRIREISPITSISCSLR